MKIGRTGRNRTFIIWAKVKCNSRYTTVLNQLCYRYTTGLKWTGDLDFTKNDTTTGVVLIKLSPIKSLYKKWSERRDLNPQQPTWKDGTLSVELLSQIFKMNCNWLLDYRLVWTHWLPHSSFFACIPMDCYNFAKK